MNHENRTKLKHLINLIKFNNQNQKLQDTYVSEFIDVYSDSISIMIFNINNYRVR